MKGIYLFVLIFTSAFTFAQKPNHGLWDSFLKTYVSTEGKVNYQQISKNSEELKAYLNELVSSQPKPNWSKNEQLVYWINAYNAYTIKLVTDHYPVKSIKDISNVWDQDFIPYNGKLISLNHIEHNILRQMDEPRIHFAIVCASVSCPNLLDEAFSTDRIELQLTQVTKGFLADSDKNTIASNYLELSKIFKWFSSDFSTKGTLIDFLNRYAKTEISNDAKIKFKDYNWALNE